MPEFEVRCHACDVSYPPGTKRCLYCGGRPGASSIVRDMSILERLGTSLEEGAPPARTSPDSQSSHEGVEPDAAEAEAEEETLASSLPRVMMNLVWVALLIVASAYRACAG